MTIQTEFPDTAPAEVENLVTTQVEEAAGVLKGLRSIHSVSRPGVSEVTLEFDWGASMDMLSMDVREKLDRLVLPEDAEDPVVLRFDPSLDPIMRLAFVGTGDLADIRQVADRKIKQVFETIKGVAAASVKGGFEEEIQINIDQERLAAMGISMDQVRQVVGASNINLPGGLLESSDSQFLIRMVNEFDSIEEIADLIISRGSHSLVRLIDVAEVKRGFREREEITRVNGTESVEIDIFKEGDANIVQTAAEVRERMDSLAAQLPEGSHLFTLFDQSRFIERAVDEVRTAALVGGALAVLILFAFLRHVRSTLIIATSIPLSVLATFMCMYRMDLSLNIMSLGGLTLGIGMLVDNAIVVIESIFRKRRDEGLSMTGAAIEGTVEVGGAVVASTLTTVAVFLPIVFVEGVAGQLFGDMAITVTLSLLASLVIAVTLIPMLSAAGSRGAPASEKALKTTELKTTENVTPMTLGWFSTLYDRFLRGALRLRWTTLFAAAVLFCAAWAAMPLIETELIPAISEGEFFFEATLPEGTPLETTNRALRQMERLTSDELGVECCYSTVGSRLVAGGMSLSTKAEHYGQMNVVLADRDDEIGEEACAERLRRGFEAIPDLAVKHGKPSYFSLKTPIEVILFSEDRSALDRYAAQVEQVLGRVPGLVDLRSSLEEGSPEFRIIFDRDRLASLGMDMLTLSDTMRNRLQGVVPTRFKDQDRQIDIRVRNCEADRAGLDDIKNLIVPGGPEGKPIRLLTLADVQIDRGPAEIHRIGQQRAAVLTGNLEGRSLGAVVNDIRAELASLPPMPGVAVELGGQNEEMQVSFNSLCFALGLAVFLVYLVMASTFESLVHPFVVLFTLPLAGVGVVAGLLLTGTEVSVIVLIGVVMLVGIVVNNAIVLIDKVNQLRREGMGKRDAVIRACHVRLRPILMTTLTTVLGLLPMALSVGEGAELRSPLAITVSFGLMMSTLLTLVVIPAVYMVVPSTVRVGEHVEESAEEADEAAAGDPLHSLSSKITEGAPA
ncbi:MAG: efflux RND transporter permease subunit [Planctomycetota bacterium]